MIVGWDVKMIEDISPLPATKKKEETLSDFLYGKTSYRKLYCISDRL